MTVPIEPRCWRQVDTEPAHSDDRVRGVELLFRLETLTQSLGQDPVHHLTNLLVVDTCQAFDRAQRAVDADSGGSWFAR